VRSANTFLSPVRVMISKKLHGVVLDGRGI
jgi:hypothetical protein